MVGYEYVIVACVVSHGVGSFWVAVSTTKEIRRILHKIHNKAKANKSQSNELKLLFSEFIHTHAVVKRLSKFLCNS